MPHYIFIIWHLSKFSNPKRKRDVNYSKNDYKLNKNIKWSKTNSCSADKTFE
jgi:hypothetical protein